MPGITHELTAVISEWGAMMDELYLSRDSNFKTIEKYTYKLIKYRTEILTGNLLAHQQKVVQKMAALYIDIGNKLLGLDMVVRDKRGNVFNTLHTPTFQLLNSYVMTVAHIRSPHAIKMYQRSITENQYQYCYYVYLSLRHNDRQSLLHHVNLVKKFTFHEVISPSVVEEYISLLITNGEFSRGNDVLNLLNWTNCPAKLLESLSELKKLDIEVLMFLHDILDALFKIYLYNLSDPSTYTFDELIFNCLLYIIELISDEHYQHFQQVLEVYVEKYFDSKLAHTKLMLVLMHNLNDLDTNNDVLFSTIKSFKYIMKFITKSILLCSESLLNNELQTYENSMYEILKSVSNLIRRIMTSIENEHLLCACLECVPQSISDIITVFSTTQLSLLLVEIIDNLSPTRLVNQKLTIMSNIVHSQLFVNADCRSILIPCIVPKILEILQNPEKDPANFSSCLKLFGDIMNLLYVADPRSTFDDITRIMMTVLRTVVEIIETTDRKDKLMTYFACMLISILRQMTNAHFDVYIMHFTVRTDTLDFLQKVLLVLKNLVCSSVFPTDWCEMVMLQNSVILKSLSYFSRAIRDYLFENFDPEVWAAFFHCAFAFVTQPNLQLENFSSNKRLRIISTYSDMRTQAVHLIQTMWFYLKQHKLYFIPGMVGSFLELSLIPENEIRKTTISIFFDMMECEFYSWVDDNRNTEDSCNAKGNFNDFQHKMIMNLDRLVASGKGDEQYKELFKSIMLLYSECDYSMMEQIIKFVETFTSQLEWLLEYQTGINDADKKKKFFCTVNLLNYYKEAKQYELSLKYVNKMYSLNFESDSFTKAETAHGLLRDKF